MFKVVLICIYMHHLGIFVKRKMNERHQRLWESRDAKQRSFPTALLHAGVRVEKA